MAQEETKVGLTTLQQESEVSEEKKEQITDLEECSICFERDSNIVLKCFHTFCHSCIEKWQARNDNCPLCRSSVLSRFSVNEKNRKTQYFMVVNVKDEIDSLTAEIEQRLADSVKFLVMRKEH